MLPGVTKTTGGWQRLSPKHDLYPPEAPLQPEL